MTIGDKHTLLKTLPEAAADFHHMFKHELASSLPLAKTLAQQLHVRGLPRGQVTSASLNLGVDVAPGQARST
eukprot:9467249-Pyramimonas_sp.AAC.1